MWCPHCQQEVPARGSARSTGARCPRCERLLNAEAAEPVAIDLAPPPSPHSDHHAAIDHSLRMAKAQLAAGEPARTLRYDLAQHGVSAAVTGSADEGIRRTTPLRQTTKRSRTGRTGQTLAWCLAALGAATLGLGLGLLGWSLSGTRPELWNAGVAATLAGQGLLIVGLVQLVAVLWNAGRGAAGRLAQMHEELRALRRSHDTAAGRHAATATQFYADLAQNAGPNVLLGNLRGQLDALSSRLRS